MDLRWSDGEEAFRAEARAWLDANVPRDLPSGDTREGFAAHLEWERALHAARLGARGGLGRPGLAPRPPRHMAGNRRPAPITALVRRRK